MATYSYSKLETFDQCQLKYRYKYIDKIKIEVPTTIEAFVGQIVHKTLEKLHLDLMFNKDVSIQELLGFFNESWENEYTDEILIAKEGYSQKNYKDFGEKCILNYYDRYKPFNQMAIIGLETKDVLSLPDGNIYHIRIDKLGRIGDVYYVCDYKTNLQFNDAKTAAFTKQLAMYSIWVKSRFSGAKKIMLLLYMLPSGTEMELELTDEKLAALQQEIMEEIKNIERTSDFKPNPTALCNYCVYHSLCPSFRHKYELSKKQPQEKKSDHGLTLVDEFSSMYKKKKELDLLLADLRQQIIEFAEQNKLSTIYGSSKKASIKEYDTFRMPLKNTSERKMLKEILQDLGKLNEVSDIDIYAVQSVLRNKSWDEASLNKLGTIIKHEKAKRVSLSDTK